MMMNCFSGMVDQQKAFSLFSSWDHCPRSSSLRISDTPQVGFEPAQNLGSGVIEWSCAVLITTTPWYHCSSNKHYTTAVSNVTTVLDAFWKSTNIQQPKLPSSRVCLILSVRLMRAWVVDYFGRKPNCNKYIRLWMSRKLDSLLYISFSMIFQY